jgi:hypothetical protein
MFTIMIFERVECMSAQSWYPDTTVRAILSVEYDKEVDVYGRGRHTQAGAPGD